MNSRSVVDDTTMPAHRYVVVRGGAKHRESASSHAAGDPRMSASSEWACASAGVDRDAVGDPMGTRVRLQTDSLRGVINVFDTLGDDVLREDVSGGVIPIPSSETCASINPTRTESSRSNSSVSWSSQR